MLLLFVASGCSRAHSTSPSWPRACESLGRAREPLADDPPRATHVPGIILRGHPLYHQAVSVRSPKKNGKRGTRVAGGVVLVHDDRAFAAEASRRIRELGREVFVYSDPMIALDTFDASEPPPGLLLTRTQFSPGQA